MGANNTRAQQNEQVFEYYSTNPLDYNHAICNNCGQYKSNSGANSDEYDDSDSGVEYEQRDFDHQQGHFKHREFWEPIYLPFPNVKPLTVFERKEYDRLGRNYPENKINLVRDLNGNDYNNNVIGAIANQPKSSTRLNNNGLVSPIEVSRYRNITSPVAVSPINRNSRNRNLNESNFTANGFSHVNQYYPEISYLPDRKKKSNGRGCRASSNKKHDNFTTFTTYQYLS